jgi:hypothetical protein
MEANVVACAAFSENWWLAGPRWCDNRRAVAPLGQEFYEPVSFNFPQIDGKDGVDYAPSDS